MPLTYEDAKQQFINADSFLDKLWYSFRTYADSLKGISLLTKLLSLTATYKSDIFLNKAFLKFYEEGDGLLLDTAINDLKETHKYAEGTVMPLVSFIFRCA